MAKPEKGLAFFMGLGEPKGKSKSKKMSESEEEDIDPAFESAIVEAFPELEGETERIAAFKRAIEACSYDEPEEEDESDEDSDY